MGTFVKSKGTNPNYRVHADLVGSIASYHRVEDTLWLSVSLILKSILRQYVTGLTAVKIRAKEADDIFFFLEQMSYNYRAPRADSACHVFL